MVSRHQIEIVGLLVSLSIHRRGFYIALKRHYRAAMSSLAQRRVSIVKVSAVLPSRG